MDIDVKLHLVPIDKPRYIMHECDRFHRIFGRGRISGIIFNGNDPIKSRT